MAVESLECCLSRAIGSSYTRSTEVGCRESDCLQQQETTSPSAHSAIPHATASGTVPARSGRSPAASSWLLSASRSRRQQPGCSQPWPR